MTQFSWTVCLLELNGAWNVLFFLRDQIIIHTFFINFLIKNLQQKTLFYIHTSFMCNEFYEHNEFVNLAVLFKRSLFENFVIILGILYIVYNLKKGNKLKN